jgi:hypothetical protein
MHLKLSSNRTNIVRPEADTGSADVNELSIHDFRFICYPDSQTGWSVAAMLVSLNRRCGLNVQGDIDMICLLFSGACVFSQGSVEFNWQRTQMELAGVMPY